ncbi:hypothetical protein H6G97_02030 [Nostoc flagelliforme FACHB-838]|uniref:Transposase n=1 Tax=Nostoc flagelliforme FACHB-838 TaxID=2692904 RepID=A0ABR8DFW3_9NOSO|nr:hypothetical protein [Nostoc flagelliforme FACHB-838]
MKPKHRSDQLSLHYLREMIGNVIAMSTTGYDAPASLTLRYRRSHYLVN